MLEQWQIGQRSRVAPKPSLLLCARFDFSPMHVQDQLARDFWNAVLIACGANLWF